MMDKITGQGNEKCVIERHMIGKHQRKNRKQKKDTIHEEPIKESKSGFLEIQHWKEIPAEEHEKRRREEKGSEMFSRFEDRFGKQEGSKQSFSDKLKTDEIHILEEHGYLKAPDR